jgi:hypothetical protein
MRPGEKKKPEKPNEKRPKVKVEQGGKNGS